LKKLRTYHFPWLKTIIILYLISNGVSHAQKTKEDWLKELRTMISRTTEIDEAKKKRIDSIHSLHQGGYRDTEYNYYAKLQQEYAVFNFDSAYYYAQKIISIAYRSGNSSGIVGPRLRISAVLLSSGMFKELFDSLNQIDPTSLHEVQKEEYYALKARAYFDLSDFNQNNIFSANYMSIGDASIDSCLVYSPRGSFRSLYFTGLKAIHRNDIWGATRYFKELTSINNLSFREQAIIHSTFSDIYIRRGLTDSAIILLTRAAIADIASSNKETTAMLTLASLLFKEGDLKNASTCIQKAVSDAKTFGARQRMVQLSSILPVIEAEKLAAIQAEKKSLIRYAVIITLVFITLVVLGIIITRQVRRQKKQQAEIGRQNKKLQHLVEEKEWLLKEIHHRVKNNLHTINSLLESQSAYLEDEALLAINNTRHRVFAMLLVHQKLYQPETNSTAIDMAAYIQELINYLTESFEMHQRVRFVMHLSPVSLDLSLAIPAGLIINEAITNSLKHGFPGDKEGTIEITITELSKNQFRFTVADNGIGLNKDLDISTLNSLGMKLMAGLSEDINARFRMDGTDGTRMTLELTAKNDQPDSIQY
jgi:two-component sensor histidine kinase